MHLSKKSELVKGNLRLRKHVLKTGTLKEEKFFQNLWEFTQLLNSYRKKREGSKNMANKISYYFTTRDRDIKSSKNVLF